MVLVAVEVKTKGTVQEVVVEMCQNEGKKLLKFEGGFGRYYAAIKEGKEVYAVVFIVKGLKDGYQIEGLHEEGLPNYYDASLELLSLLTPTKDPQAIIWRKRTAIKE
jgi:hypothetical protein